MDEKLESALWCLVYGLGIIGMLGLYGVLQQRIMSEPYDPAGTCEYFKVSVFLVLCNRLVAITYAVGMAVAKNEEKSPKAPFWKYLAVSFSNVAATACQYEALKYVSFPVQMLGKSFKMMPVMLWSMLISQKRYKAVDWGIAAGVTFGVTGFLLAGPTGARHSGKGGDTGGCKKESHHKGGGEKRPIYGMILMMGFLACDGFTSTFQEKLFKQHKTSKYNQMMYINLGSAIVSAFSLLASGMAMTAINFSINHHDFVGHATALSAAAVAGQFFIYSQVKEYGALVLAATMNMRQVISILVSYLVYPQPVTLGQVGSLVVVFASLFYKSYLGYVGTGDDGHSKETAKADNKIEPQKIGADDESETDSLKKPSGP